FGFGVRVHGQKSVAAGASVEVSGTDETGTLDVGSVCSDSGVAESLITRPFTYRTSRPGIAAMRSPGVMMPARLSGSAAETAIGSVYSRVREARRESTAAGNAN